MPAMHVRHPLIRVVLATTAGQLAAFVISLASILPTWLSPSNPPWSWASVVAGLPLAFLFEVLPLTLWLLPAGLVTRWILERRKVRGFARVLPVAIVVGAAAASTLLLATALLEWPPAREDWSRGVPAAIQAVAFVVTGLVLLDRLAPAPEVVPAQPMPVGRLASRVTAETLAAAGVLLWTSILGCAGGVVLDFGGDGKYRVRSTVDSPGHATRLYVVDRSSPGGTLGDTCSEVYLLENSKTWSARHRGWLIWRSEQFEVHDAQWESEHDVAIHVLEDPKHPAARHASAYSRAGFRVRTAVDPD